MTEFSQDQLSILHRIITRHHKMHLAITPFAVGLGMRANGHDLPLEQIKTWLAENEADPVPEDHYKTPDRIKPEADSTSGVHEKETTKMQNAQQPIDNGQWEKYVPEDTPRIPTWGPDLPGQPGTVVESDGRQYYLGAFLEGGVVRDELVTTRNGPEPGRVLTVKTSVGDIAFWPNAMARKGLDGLKVTLGDYIRVVYIGKRKSVSNPTRSYKAYEVYKMRKPGQAAAAPSYTPPAPANGQPLASQQPADQGAAWLESQRASAAQVGGH